MKEVERRAKAMGVLRVLSIAATLLALAGLVLPLPTRARTISLALDVSDSIGREGIEASREAALSLIRRLEPRDRVAVATFAGKARLLTDPVPPSQAAALVEAAVLGAQSPGATDIPAAIAAAGTSAAKGPGSKTLFLFSDGRSNSGSPLSALSLARSRLTIDTVPSGRAASGLVAEGLSAPELSRPGERTTLVWRLFSAEAGSVGYSIEVDGRLAARGKARLSAGLNEIPLAVDAGASGKRAITVEASLADGSSPDEARSGAYLEVGAEAKVLVVSGAGPGTSPIAKALRAQGIRAKDGGAADLPAEAAGYEGLSAVVLDDLPALDIGESQQAALQDYVAGGGGLLVVGGESSLGRGEYYATPLEDMLPVETDTRQRLLFTRSKLLFIIDHSGSMSEKVGPISKEMAAMRGVAASLKELGPLDEVGIIGFDSSPTWVLPFTPAGEREKILASLSTLGEGGGTDLASALEEAIKGFGEPDPTDRHAIVLTDGLTPDADFRGLSARLTAAGVSVSTIGIGDDIDEDLLRNIAQWCGGKYYRAEGDRIPTVIDKETLRMTRDLIQEGRIETRVSSESPVVEGLGDPLPPVAGYLRTKAKDFASVLLEAEAPQPSPKAGPVAPWDPLLASWRYGNGKVAVFTADSGRRWLSAWSGRDAYNRLWGQTLRSIERAAPDSTLRATAIVEGGNAHIVVEAEGPDRRSLTSLRLSGRSSSPLAGSGGSAFGLDETAPGRYEGYAPLGSEGLADYEILDPTSGVRASAWAWIPPRLESSRLGPDYGSLSLIASSTGGRLLSSGTLEPPAPTLRWRSLAMGLPLLVLAALLFVAELYLRSTMTGQVARATAALASWWSAQKAAAEAARLRRRREEGPTRDADADARYAEMQRRIAEHVARRYRDREEEGERDA